MSTRTLVSLDEYLTTSYRPDREYVEGMVLERNVGEYDHSRLQGRLIIYLGSREKQWGIRVVPEQRVQVRSNRFRVPDVCAVKSDSPVEQIFKRPPLLCVEILSPEDRMAEMQDRIHDYLAFGVSFVWLLDPRTRRAYFYTAAGMQEVLDGILRAGDPIAVPLAELFD
ncbi:MAG: Uma2 family endonuclease [Acidobacteria bacterium]|nr:Uma2 family endonuclease [Acidobacteriota bacterium]